MSSESATPRKNKKFTPTQFLLKGLAISLPPILTLVILLWVLGGINTYIIHPVSTSVRWSIAQFTDDAVRPAESLVTLDGLPRLEFCDRNYRITPELSAELIERRAERDQRGDGGIGASEIPSTWVLQNSEQVFVPLGEEAVPYDDYADVGRIAGPGQIPTTTTGIYMELVTKRYFTSLFHLSVVAVAVAVIVLYFLGRFMTARLGRWLMNKFETVVLGNLPVISNVYGSVKQVTDFFLTERKVEYNRVVAIEYPRRGLWSLGFVTGDSLLELTVAAGEPLVSVLMPTSPMPMTGFTISVPRNEVLDLNITIDQAFQYCLSCGVLVPSDQKVTPEALERELARHLPKTSAEDADIIPAETVAGKTDGNGENSGETP